MCCDHKDTTKKMLKTAIKKRGGKISANER